MNNLTASRFQVWLFTLLHVSSRRKPPPAVSFKSAVRFNPCSSGVVVHVSATHCYNILPVP